MSEEEEYFDAEEALAELLKEEVLFCNSRDYVCPFGGKGGHTVVLFVCCNDIFAWGCADAEDFGTNDIEPLHKMFKADNKWGPSKWCCIRRNEQPQAPVIEYMKGDGAWDDVMEALPENEFDRRWREHRAAQATAGSST